MSKTPITWIELINQKIKERKAKNMPAGVRDVVGEAKKDWALIKEGKHDKYIKGTPSPTKRKSKGKKSKHSKTSKTGKHSKTGKQSKTNIKDIIKKCNLCEECIKEINKHMD
jgi:hypothetical protein